jgi:hypothetical protein
MKALTPEIWLPELKLPSEKANHLNRNTLAIFGGNLV